MMSKNVVGQKERIDKIKQQSHIGRLTRGVKMMFVVVHAR